MADAGSTSMIVTSRQPREQARQRSSRLWKEIHGSPREPPGRPIDGWRGARDRIAGIWQRQDPRRGRRLTRQHGPITDALCRGCPSGGEHGAATGNRRSRADGPAGSCWQRRTGWRAGHGASLRRIGSSRSIALLMPYGRTRRRIPQEARFKSAFLRCAHALLRQVQPN